MKKFEDLMSVKNEIENISASEAKEKLNDQNVQFIDVRDKESFDKGTIGNAIHLDRAFLEFYLAEGSPLENKFFKENPNKESCRERMKELIRVKKLNRNQVVKRCMREFDDVHKSTFYGWYDEVINEPDIVSWEEDRKLEIVSEYQEKHDLVERMFRRNMEQYDKYCDDYEENEDTETLANIEKYEDRLKYFIKK